MSEFSRDYKKKMYSRQADPLEKTDPDFTAFFDNFIFDEVVNEDDLDDKTRFIAILATLIGCQGTGEYKIMLEGALNSGVSPVEAKEIVYQAVAYIGMGRTLDIFHATNEVMSGMGIKLPLESQSATTEETRLLKGADTQAEIFGPHMKEFYKSGPEERRHINRWLAANCFGDYYTRGGLDLKQREMVTFCLLSAQGGCESQLRAHAGANMKMGNDKAFLIKVVSQAMPYIGYPRTLNALQCVNEAEEALGKG